MSEIQAYIDNDQKASNIAQHQLVEAFTALDRCVERLFGELSPERYMLVSDHGTEPYLKRIDLNVFLRKHGFQPYAGAQLSLANKFRKAARRTLPQSLRVKLSKSMPGSVKSRIVSHGVDLARSQAFAARYVPGVYINDARFGGPVSENARAEIIEKFCAAFNTDAEAAENGLSASPYKSEYGDSQFAWMLPDVWIEHPDTVFFEHGLGEGFPSGGRFIYPNEAFGSLPALSEVTRDLWSGIKGRTPLLAVDARTAALIRSQDPTDLRLAYHLIERNFT